MQWFKILSTYRTRPTMGPWKSLDKAEAAIEKFRQKHGHLAGTYLIAGSAGIFGFATRQAARQADLSIWCSIGGRKIKDLR